MAKKISGSVGKGGKNKPEDTQLVQELLNAFTKEGGYKKLDVDGLIGPKTNSAIASFQKKVVGMSRTDSRVDSGGKTFSTLAMGPKKAKAEAKKATSDKKKESQGTKEKAKGKKEDSQDASRSNAKPRVKGATQGVKKQILAVLEAVSSHYNKPIVIENGKQKSQPGTASGDNLWQEWGRTLDRGKRDPNLRKNEKLRKELDNFYSHADKESFLKTISKNSNKLRGKSTDAHATGRAFDIKRNTDPKVVAALATILRREDEGDLIHFDDTGKTVPKTINESVKKKWK